MRTCLNCGNPHIEPACPDCSIDAPEMASLLCGILDPCSREEALDEMDAQAENIGACSVELSGGGHGADWFTLTLGGAEYQISVKRTR